MSYPEGWSVNRGDVAPECTAFHPTEFELRPGTEFPRELAVVLSVEPVALEQASSASGVSIEEQRRLTIDGQRAVRQVVSSTGEGLDPAGLRSVRLVIGAGERRSIVMITHDLGDDRFERNAGFLDKMGDALEITPRR